MDRDKIIAMDVDGVIADLAPAWLARYNHDYNDNLKPSDLTGWDTHKFVKPECGFKMYDYLKDPHLYDDVLPTDGALDAINILKAHDYRIVYVTVTPIDASGRKFFWLRQYTFITDIKDYVEASDKSLIRAGTIVDDKPENLDTFDGKKILFVQPWNQFQQYNPNYLSAINWKDVLFYILGEIK